MRRLSPHEASEIGKKGGRNGKGASKRRPKEHYQNLAKIRQAKALKRRLDRLKGLV
jgi:hypothetical protein